MEDFMRGDDDIEDYMYEDDEDYGSDISDSLQVDEGIELEDDEANGSRSHPSQIITKESLLEAQKADLSKVMEMLNLTEQHARTLLIHHLWNVVNLVAVLVEKGKDRLYREAGVIILDRDKSKGESLPSSCNVCMEDDIALEQVTAMECGHCFCNNCWTEHFIVKISDGQSKRIKCMAHKCNAICDEAVVRDLVSARNPDLAERFERFLLESYIDDNKLVKWCPSVPHCGNAIRVKDDNDELREVECVCGHQFCFGCSSEPHSPCSCLMWERWMKRCKDDSETMNWMSANTKPCPKCYKPAQKISGCNLVTCVCGQHFCWLCGAATGWDHTLENIKGHSCGRYREDREQKDRHSEKDLYRYMHYHNRYQAHIESAKFETKLRKKVQGKILALEETDSKNVDFSWLTNGLYRLFRSRKILSYSYAFAYYMFGDLFRDQLTKEDIELKQSLFEDQQQRLESNIEILSKYLEEEFDYGDKDKFREIRMEVINLSVNTDNVCHNMYECIENDLLDSLQGTHSIAPYRSKGVQRAIEVG